MAHFLIPQWILLGKINNIFNIRKKCLFQIQVKFHLFRQHPYHQDTKQCLSVETRSGGSVSAITPARTSIPQHAVVPPESTRHADRCSVPYVKTSYPLNTAATGNRNSWYTIVFPSLLGVHFQAVVSFWGAEMATPSGVNHQGDKIHPSTMLS